jgi:hypothetical protein
MRLLVVAALLVMSAASAMAQGQGDWVLARWQGGRYWFPGVIQSLGDGRAVILYDDGDRENLPTNLVRPYDWAVGTRVQCNYQGAGTWYEGRITAVANATIDILYDDGDREQTTTARCRSE